MEKLGDQILFLGRVLRDRLVDSRLRRIRSRLETSVDSKCGEDTNDRVTGRAGEREARRGKLLHMCQERADIMYSVKETARMITCPTESDEVNVKVFRAQSARSRSTNFLRS